METPRYPRFLAVWWWLVLAMDGAIFVMRSRRTRRGTAQRAHDALARSNIRILGVVLNGVPLSRGNSYYHYYRANADNVKKSALDRRQQPADAAPAAH